jgi:tRNA A-37 threonylcarbamoyl transferase component Bud32
VGNTFGNFDQTFELRGEGISESEQSEVFKTEVEGKVFYVKRYIKTLGVGSWFGFSRLCMEVRNLGLFAQLGIATSPLVAYGEKRFLLKTLRGVLVTEAVENALDLEELVSEHPAILDDKNWYKETARQLAQITAKLHGEKFCHNDMHWRNILVRNWQTTPDVYLIDCPAGKHFSGWLLKYRILKDLANLDKNAHQYFTRTQRLRFFKYYRQVDKLTASDKNMIYDILKHKAHRIRRKQRQSRSRISALLRK